MKVAYGAAGHFWPLERQNAVMDHLPQGFPQSTASRCARPQLNL
jgi:hypothetical protein